LRLACRQLEELVLHGSGRRAALTRKKNKAKEHANIGARKAAGYAKNKATAVLEAAWEKAREGRAATTDAGHGRARATTVPHSEGPSRGSEDVESRNIEHSGHDRPFRVRALSFIHRVEAKVEAQVPRKHLHKVREVTSKAVKKAAAKLDPAASSNTKAMVKGAGGGTRFKVTGAKVLWQRRAHAADDSQQEQ
jgi:hypothetical protein